MRPAILLLLILSFSLSACRSGERALEQGDYDRALSQAVNRLQSDNDNQKAIATLKRAHKLAQETHLLNIQRHRSSPDPLRWEKIWREYEALNHIFGQLQRCPACRAHVPAPQQYNSEILESREKAAEARYQLALEALQNKHQREKAKEAHHHLNMALQFIPGYKNSNNLMEEALDFAMLHILVLPLPDIHPGLRIDQQFFNNRIQQQLHHQKFNPYLRFYSLNEARQVGLRQGDHEVIISVQKYIPLNELTESQSEKVSRDSVLVKGRGEQERYQKVSAEFSHHRKIYKSEAVLDLQIIDPSLQKVIFQDKFSGLFTHEVEWHSFRGDERALSEAQREKVVAEPPAPAPEFMFQQTAAPLYDRALKSLISYYKNY